MARPGRGTKIAVAAVGGERESVSVERDQRVADAISQSDLLIEIDDAGVIAFLAGALERLGAGAAR